MAKLAKYQKVFGIGLSRTGTTSLTEALNMLGIKTIHFPHDQVTYDELRKGNYRLSILEKYQGITDIPVVPYYAQFDKVYPGSKFILTVREIGPWLNSLEDHWRLPRETGLYEEFSDFVRTCTYGTIEYNEDRFRYVYETHFRNVCDYFSHRPSDLLVMNIVDGDGWEKLCAFLGFPIPDVSFPHLNKREEHRKWMEWRDLAIQDISTLIPPRNAFILVDDMKLAIEVIDGCRPMPFLERERQNWGPPRDDRSAIVELERLKQSGASFLVFTWPSFWWLDYYAELHGYLRSKYRVVMENERLVVFDLGR
jgi:hypothetical protein